MLKGTSLALAMALFLMGPAPVEAAPGQAVDPPPGQEEQSEDLHSPDGRDAPHDQAEQQSEDQELPPYPDAVGGFQVSIFGGNVFSGSNALQVGGTLSYFFKPTAWIGFEVEGATTLAPGGRVTHASANLVLQTGARTSRIVPYLTAGGGFVQASLDLPEATQRELDRLGVIVDPDTESGPSLNYGGGVRYYLREKIAVRGDFRSTLVLRDTDESFFDRLFTINRIAGMLNIEF